VSVRGIGRRALRARDLRTDRSDDRVARDRADPPQHLELPRARIRLAVGLCRPVAEPAVVLLLLLRAVARRVAPDAGPCLLELEEARVLEIAAVRDDALVTVDGVGERRDGARDE